MNIPKSNSDNIFLDVFEKEILPKDINDCIILKKDKFESIFYSENTDVAYNVKTYVDGRQALEVEEYHYKNIFINHNTAFLETKNKNNFKYVGYQAPEFEMIKYKFRKMGISFKSQKRWTWNSGYSVKIFLNDADAAMFRLYFSDHIFTSKEWKNKYDIQY